MATYRMNPRISVITLGVNDLEQALAFYRDGLGLQTKGIIGTEFTGDETNPSGAIVVFELQNGVILALYPRTELAKDAQEAVGGASSTEFSLGHLVQSKEEVDTLMKQAEAAGATVTSQPHERPWGIYSGYFKDGDGHLWEILWNPQTHGIRNEKLASEQRSKEHVASTYRQDEGRRGEKEKREKNIDRVWQKT